MSAELFLSNEAIIVRIDSDLEELVPGFLENRYKDLEVIAAAIERADFALIQQIGHKMKGSGSGYGFDFITEVGRRLEQAAKQANLADIRLCHQALSFYLARLEIHWLPASHPRVA